MTGSAFRPGQELGCYRVVDFLARGGMGEVWSGQDARFERAVALKALLGEVASDPQARRRFLDEARRTARVSHPYVAAVYDVVDRPEGPVLVMEYVRGRTLDQVLAGGPVAPALAARYAVEIAEALEAIHAAGIVHRDLKPGNVMITEQDHVKVMDFGVAQRAPDALGAGSSSDTAPAPGTLSGTIPYMSPEQLRGGRVDARSDLFSLGIVLYETLVGRHPFPGTTIPEVSAAILHQEPGTEQDRARLRETGNLGQAVFRLLQKDPDQRFRRAGELLDTLRGGALPLRPRARRRSWIALSAATLLVAALAALVLWTRQHALPARPGRPAVAVLPFDDRSGVEDSAERGRMVADLLAASLGETARLRSIGSERVFEVLAGLSTASGRPERLRKLRDEVSPAWIVSGTLYQEAGESLAAVEVYRGSSLELAASFQARAPGSGALAEEIATRVVRTLEPPAAPGFGAPQQARVVSRDDEAVRLLRRARDLARRLEDQAAIEVVEQALQKDPSYVDARVLLADLLSRAGYEARARDAIVRALRDCEAQGVTQDSRQWLEARAVWGRLFDPSEATRTLRTLAARYADEPETLLALSAALRSQGAAEEALSVLDQALLLDGSDPRSNLSRGRTLLTLGRTAEGTAALRTAETRFESLASMTGLGEVSMTRALAAFRGGRFEEAAKEYALAAERYAGAGSEVQATIARKSIADMELQLWRLEEAERGYARALPALVRAGQYTQAIQTLGGWGGVLVRLGRVDEAETRFEEAVDKARMLGNESLLAVPVLNLANLQCATGQAVAAERATNEVLAIAEARKDSSIVFSARLVHAVALRQQGRLSEAIDALRELAAGPVATANPTLRALVLGHLSQAAEVAERPADALQAASEAVTAVSKSTPESAFHLASRARLEASLGQGDDALRDLDAARALVPEPAHVPPEERDALARTRACIAAWGGHWAEALAAAAEVSKTATLDRWAAELWRAEALLELGRAREAQELARTIREHAWPGAAEHAAAGLLLARALMRIEQRTEARRVARAALDEARAHGMPLTAARAEALLGRPGERSKASVWLQAYLDNVPVERREYVRSRRDVRELE